MTAGTDSDCTPGRTGKWGRVPGMKEHLKPAAVFPSSPDEGIVLSTSTQFDDFRIVHGR